MRPAFNAPVCGVFGVSLPKSSSVTPARLASVLLPLRLKAGKQGLGGADFSTVWNVGIPPITVFGIPSLKRLITSGKASLPSSRGTLDPHSRLVVKCVSADMTIHRICAIVYGHKLFIIKYFIDAALQSRAEDLRKSGRPKNGGIRDGIQSGVSHGICREAAWERDAEAGPCFIFRAADRCHGVSRCCKLMRWVPQSGFDLPYSSQRS